MVVSSLADALFGKTRQAVLATLFINPERRLHLREIARLGGVSAPTMQRELEALLDAGLVTDARRGNQRLFQANPASPLFEELRSIAVKTCGIGDLLRRALADACADIDLAFVFGSMARGTARPDSDVDVLVIGAMSYYDVLGACRSVGERIGRPVNATVFTNEEFGRRLEEGNGFVRRVLAGDKIFLIGDEARLRQNWPESMAVGQSGGH